MTALARWLSRAAVNLSAVALLAACASGAVDGSDPPGSDPTNQGGNSVPDAGGGDDFGWLPPIGETGPQATLGTALNLLHAGDCDAAAAYLDEGDPPNWTNFTSPRNVLLYMAGIELCRDDVAGARPWFNQADAMGWAGSDDVNTCRLYRAVASVIRQRSPDSFRCLGGDPPQYVVNEQTGVFDDPRTPGNEAAAAPSDEASPSDDVEPSDDASPSGIDPSAEATDAD